MATTMIIQANFQQNPFYITMDIVTSTNNGQMFSPWICASFLFIALKLMLIRKQCAPYMKLNYSQNLHNYQFAWQWLTQS